MPSGIVRTKNQDQPIASTVTPVIGPEITRGMPKNADSSAYCAAEKRFWVSRSSSTENAPVPRPWVRFSKPIAPYIAGLLVGMFASNT